MANTRPIRRLPFPRRPFRRRRPALSWTNAIFQGNALDPAGTTTKFTLIEHADVEPTGSILATGGLRIHRVQLKGFIELEPITDAEEAGHTDWIWALWQQDADETDEELFGTTGNIFPQKHIIKWDWMNWRTSALAESNNNDTFFSHSAAHKVAFDLKFRRPLVLPVDGQLILGVQCQLDNSATIANAQFKALSRIIVQLPGTGR